MHEFILEAWELCPKAQATPLKSDEELDSSNYWIHCDRGSSEFELWMVNQGIEESVRASLLAEDTRPRFQQLDENSFILILRGVNLNKGKDPDDMLTIRLLYSSNRVITCNQQRSRAIDTVVTELRQGRGPKSIESLVIAIISQLNAKIDSLLEPIEQFVDAQDSDSFSNEQITEIGLQHRKLLRLNRFLKPQIYALAALSKNKVVGFEGLEVDLFNQLDVLQRIVDSIDFYIAQIEVINNRIALLSSETMNRNTYLLSIIAGIFLPLGFLTGLFGINIGGMPGIDNSHGFYWFCGMLTGICIFEIYIFKRLKFL